MDASPKEKFDAAVKVIQTLPKNGSFQPSYALMQKFYGYYKQATNGPCNVSKPAFWDVVGKAKWEAWSALGDMPSEEAMTAYVNELKKIIETMPHTPMVTEFISKLGDFYEMVDDQIGNDYRRLKPLLNNTKSKANTEIDDVVGQVMNGNLLSDLDPSLDVSDTSTSSAEENPQCSCPSEQKSEIDSEDDEFCDTLDSPPVQLIAEENRSRQFTGHSQHASDITFENIPNTSSASDSTKRNNSRDERELAANPDVVRLIKNIAEDIAEIQIRMKKLEEVVQKHNSVVRWLRNNGTKTLFICIVYPFLIHFLLKWITRRRR